MTLRDENIKLIKQNLRFLEMYEHSEKQRLSEQQRFSSIISNKNQRIRELKEYINNMKKEGFVCRV